MNAENDVQSDLDLPETEYFEDTSDDIIDSSEEGILKHSYVFKNGIEIVQKRKQCVLRWVHFDNKKNRFWELLQRTLDTYQLV